MTRYVRAVVILWVILRYGLDELALSGFRLRGSRADQPFGRRRHLDAPRGQRLRQALEALGPIFVKFGQVLSTRRDLLPPDIADELAMLQDRVPPFPSAGGGGDHRARLQAAAGRRLRELRARAGGQRLDRAGALRHGAPAQRRGREVAVKVLRPACCR